MARYKKGAKARDLDLFSPKLPLMFINPQLVKATAISDKTLRQEYTRLRDIAQKRIKRMEGKPEAAGTLANLPEGGFPKLRGMSREDIVYNLMEMADFLSAKRNSISGIRDVNKRISEKLQEKGLDIPKEQLANYGNFMSAFKKALGAEKGSFVSQQLMRFYSETLEKGKMSKTALTKAINKILKEQEEQSKIKYSRSQRMAKNKLIQSGDWSSFFDFLEEE